MYFKKKNIKIFFQLFRNLHGNDFSGTIPEEIGKLTNLETL